MQRAATTRFRRLPLAHVFGSLASPRWAMSHRSDESAIEDIVQDTLVKALSGASNCRSKSKLSTWLFSIARVTCIDHLRRRGRSPADTGFSTGAEPGRTAQRVPRQGGSGAGPRGDGESGAGPNPLAHGAPSIGASASVCPASARRVEVSRDCRGARRGRSDGEEPDALRRTEPPRDGQRAG